MWKGHFHPILLRGAFDVAVMPIQMQWTQYSHVSLTFPRLRTCEHPIHNDLFSCLPSPHILQSVGSSTVVNEDSVVCVSLLYFFLGEKENEGPATLAVVDVVECLLLSLFVASVCERRFA